MWWLILFGCSGDPDGPEATSGTDDTSDTSDTSDSETAFAPDLPIGGCGMDEYTLVGPEELGQIVLVEPAEDLTMGVSTIATVLGIAGVPPERFQLVHDVETWRVRYTTQDRGEVVEASMILSYPVDAGPVPTMMWGHGTTGFMDDCAPTLLGLEGGAFNLLFSSMGFVVAAPDYIGMVGVGEPSGQLHPYVIPEPTAFASLDAVRAAWRFQESQEGLSSEGTRQTVWAGGSEGGFAALWTDRYAPHYLPEAEPIAVVASVPPADVPALVDEATQTFSDATAGLAAALTSWDDWYGFDALDEVLADPLPDVLPDLLGGGCDTSIDPEPTTVQEVFTASYIAAVADGTVAEVHPDVACAAEKGLLVASEVPDRSDAPVLYIVSEEDDLVLAAPTRDAYGPLCEAGYAMNYIECAGASHTEGAIWSLGQAADWVLDRVAGLPMEAVCSQPAPEICDLQDDLE